MPLIEMDLDTDAVWGQGGGARMREKEAAERARRDEDDITEGRRTKVLLRRIGRQRL